MKRPLALLGALAAFLLTGPALAQLASPSDFVPYGTRDGLFVQAPAAVVADDADVVLWVAAVTTNGGTTSTTQRARLSTLVAALKAGTSWALTDDYFVHVAENTAQALTSLKQRRLGVAVGGPLFGYASGYNFNGSSSYVDTGFNPSTMAVAMSINVVRLAIYQLNDIASNQYSAGTGQSAGRNIRIRPRQTLGTTMLADSNTSGGTFNLPAPDARGYSSVSRADATTATVKGYKRGLPMVRSADATAFGASLPAFTLFIGGLNNGGTLTAPCSCTSGLVAIGAALSDAAELAEANAVQAYMVAWGQGS